MANSFKQKHSLDLDLVLFAVWAASFFATHTGLTSRLAARAERTDRTMSSLSNLLFRGYSMAIFTLDQLAKEAIWWAKHLKQKQVFSVEEVREALEFISLSQTAQKSIGLWSGGKRPIIIPSMSGIMIDLAAIIPFLHTIFFGLKKSFSTRW
jgi:hypothetical protein